MAHTSSRRSCLINALAFFSLVLGGCSRSAEQPAEPDDLVPEDIGKAAGLDGVRCVLPVSDRYGLREDAQQAGEMMAAFKRVYVLQCAALCATRANMELLKESPTGDDVYERSRHLDAMSQRLAQEAKAEVEQAAMACSAGTADSAGGRSACIDKVTKAIDLARRCLEPFY